MSGGRMAVTAHAGHLGCECPCGGAHLRQKSIDRQAASRSAAVRWVAAWRQAELDRQRAADREAGS